MKKPPLFVLCLLLCLAGSGSAADIGRPMPGAGQSDAATLAALIRAPSFREADKLAVKLLAGPALDASTQAICGLAVLKAGRIAEAEAIFKKVIERSPDSPDAHLGLGRIARIRNDEDASHAGPASTGPSRPSSSSRKRSASSGGPPGPAASFPTSPRSARSPRSAAA